MSDYKSRFKPDHEPNSKDREGRINRRANHQINAANDEKSRRETGYSPTKREIRNKRLRGEEYNMSEAVQDIINLTLTGSPVDVKAALEVAITEKIGAALEARKAIIANSLVGIGETHEITPSAIHKDEKSERAKRIAMNKIKDRAKNEGVDMSDEQAEELLEALLEDDTKTVTKETLDYVREWFTEEELDELSRKTMATYVKKAHHDKEDQQDAMRYHARKGQSMSPANAKVTRKWWNRSHGINTALTKLSKD